jgi:ribonuclease R
MTYTQVAGLLVDRDPALLERYSPLVREFEAMETLARRLHARRRERGSIDFDLPEPEIVLNARGEMTGVFPSPRTIAHRIIEEFMLAANEAVASHLLDDGVPTLYRVHERPDPRRLEALDQVLQGLGYRVPRPLEAVEPRHLQEILDHAAGKPEERFVSQLVLRALMQARYDPKNLGHFGLAAPRYTHFTSPIRRYPDLLVHRAIKAVLGRRRYEPGNWRELGAHCSTTERRADDATRDVVAWLKCYYMKDRVGETFPGSISGVTAFGAFVALDEVYVEGLVHVSELGADYFHFDAARHHLMGERTRKRYRLGDRVRVKVVRVDLDTSRIDFTLA